MLTLNRSAAPEQLSGACMGDAGARTHLVAEQTAATLGGNL